MNENGIRTFIAIELPDELVSAIVSKRRGLEGSLPKARWVSKENQHLTLRFLGDVLRPELERMVSRLTTELKGVPAVTATLGGAGFFPNASRPRVAWVGGDAEGVERVLEGVDAAVSKVNPKSKDKPWTLHLTQARLVKPWRADAVRTFLDWGQALDVPPFEAREVVVFTSDLQPGGPVYTAVERIHLA